MVPQQTESHPFIQSLTTPTAVGFFLNLKLLLKGKFHILNFPLRKQERKRKASSHANNAIFLIFSRHQTGFPTRNKELTS